MSETVIAAVDLKGVVTASVFQITICSICFLGFALMRTFNKAVYQPKVKYADERKRPKELPGHLIGWITPILYESDYDLVDKVGIDGWLFLRFTKFGSRLFGIMTLFAIPMMVINYYAPNIKSGIPAKRLNGTEIYTLALSSFTISNVPSGSNLLYIHAVVAYIFTFGTFYMLYQSWMDYINVKQYYYSTQEYLASFTNKILLFTDNSTSKRSEESFKRYLKEFRPPHEPENIYIGRNYRELPKLIETHMNVTCRFEHVLVKYLQDPLNLPPRPQHRINGSFFNLYGGQMVDSINYYSKELKELERKIYSLRALPDRNFDADSSAFVSFQNIRDAHEVLKAVANPIGMGKDKITNAVLQKPTVRLCPAIDDLLWENAGLGPALKNSRAVIAALILAGLITGWFFLQSVIATLTSGILVAQNNSESQAGIIFLQSLIAPTLNSILNLLLPYFLRMIATLQGVLSESGVERSSLYKFYVFQVYQLGIQITSAFLFAYIQTLIVDGKNNSVEFLLQNCAEAYVAKSSYFITILVTGYTYFGIEIIQGYSLVYNFIMNRFFKQTPRDESLLCDTPKFDFLPVYGFLLLSFLLVMSYSITSPLIVPFGFFVFFLAYLTYKYQLLYVYETKHETGGAWFPKVFNMIIVCIAIFQFLTFGALVLASVKNTNGKDVDRAPNLMVFALVFVSLLFWIYITYVVRPRADFISKDIDVEVVKYERDARLDSDVLKDRLFNPVIIKLLPKIWVPKGMKSFAQTLYDPEFNDVIDFVSKTDPVHLAEVQSLEKEREQKRKTFGRKRSSTFSNYSELTHVPSASTLPNSGSLPNLYLNYPPSTRHQSSANSAYLSSSPFQSTYELDQIPSRSSSRQPSSSSENLLPSIPPRR